MYRVVIFLAGVLLTTQALASNKPTANSPKPAKQSQTRAIYNDGATGIQDRTLVRINDLPCGRNGKDRFLVCLPRVNIADNVSVFQDTRYLIQHFSEELKRWNSNAKEKDSQWSALLYSNLSGIVFDPKIKSPELRIQRGTGNPIPESEMSFYLRLPLNFSLEKLRKWIKKLGEESREDPIAAKFQELPTNEFMSMVFRCPGDIRVGGIQTYQPGSIVIDKINSKESQYADAKAEQDAVELAIDIGKQENMKAIYEQCDRDRMLASFQTCLMKNRYSGSVDDKQGELRIVGHMLDGKWEGTFRDYIGPHYHESEYVHGDQKGVTRHHIQTSDGRYYVETETEMDAQGEHYVGPVRKYHPGGGLRLETYYNEQDRIETIYYYCPDGRTVMKMETLGYDGEGNRKSSEDETETYPCP